MIWTADLCTLGPHHPQTEISPKEVIIFLAVLALWLWACALFYLRSLLPLSLSQLFEIISKKYKFLEIRKIPFQL